MDLFLLQKIAVARLQQRCIPLDTGALLFRPRRGGGAVRLTSEEWSELGSQFHRATAPSARLLGWAIWLQIPLALATLILMLRVPGMRILADRLDGVLPWLSVLLLTTWPLLLGAAWHYRQVVRALVAVEMALARRPRIALPVLPGRTGLNVLEIAAMLLIGPHLIVHLYGTLSPHAFDNTPWSGTSLGPGDVAGLAVLAALLILRGRRERPGVADPMEPDVTELGRRKRRFGPGS